MKFEIGDKVVILLTNEDAEVVDIINEKMVMIDVRGVKFPAYTDQLDFPYFKQFMEKKQANKPAPAKKYIDQLPKEKKVAVADKRTPTGVWLTFIPSFTTDEFGDDVVELLKVHLINQTETAFRFQYSLNYGHQTDFELKNEVLAFQDFYLHDIAFENLNDNPVFDCVFELVNPDKNKAPYFETTLKLKAKQVFNKLEEIKEKGEPTFSYKLFEHYPGRKYEEPLVDLGKLSGAGFKVYDISKVKQNLPPARSVVDLHIERLTDRWEHLSHAEILDIQLREFEKYYELAVTHRQTMLTVIHGVGTGRLKDEIHDLLKWKKEVKSFINQYHSSYGYGATEIYFNL